MKKLSSGSAPQTGNPDPCNFSILNWRKQGRYIIVKVRYPDCTNYEGEKILVYRDVTIEQLQDDDYLDPHFTADEISPIARFVPTNEGWWYAVQFVKSLGDEYRPLETGLINAEREQIHAVDGHEAEERPASFPQNRNGTTQ